MDTLEKTKVITKVVWNSVWLAAALFFWILGLYAFSSEPNFLNWFFWAAFSTPFVIIYILKFAGKSSKDSERDGAHHYTIYSSGRVSNHAFGGAVFGFVVGLVLGILGGPIILPLSAVKKTTELINNIKYLKASKE